MWQWHYFVACLYSVVFFFRGEGEEERGRVGGTWKWGGERGREKGKGEGGKKANKRVGGLLETLDQYQYLSNYPPTPPLTQQQSIDNNLRLTLG